MKLIAIAMLVLSLNGSVPAEYSCGKAIDVVRNPDSVRICNH